MQQASDTGGHGAVGGGQCEGFGGVRPFGQRHQGFGQGVPLALGLEDTVVATMFALAADLFRDPPHGRMVEEQGLDRALQQVDEWIPPVHVGQLMQQQRLDLQAWQTLEHSKRQHEHRPEPPDDERPVDAG